MEDKKLNFNQDHQPVAPQQEDKDEQERQQLQEEDNVDVAAELKKRTCPHCRKEFRNGKALGGHLRVHAENNKSRPVKRPLGSSSSPEETAQSQVCTICFKSFKSKNSLYGHMRIHSDRKRRGMQPPSHNSGIIINGPGEPEPESLLSAVNKLGVVKSWKVTRKRGRYAEVSSSSSFGHHRGGEAGMHFADGDNVEETGSNILSEDYSSASASALSSASTSWSFSHRANG